MSRNVGLWLAPPTHMFWQHFLFLVAFLADIFPSSLPGRSIKRSNTLNCSLITLYNVSLLVQMPMDKQDTSLIYFLKSRIKRLIVRRQTFMGCQFLSHRLNFINKLLIVSYLHHIFLIYNHK